MIKSTEGAKDLRRSRCPQEVIGNEEVFFPILYSPEKKKRASKDWIITYFILPNDNVIPERGILQTTPNVSPSTPRGLFAISSPQFIFLSFL